MTLTLGLGWILFTAVAAYIGQGKGRPVLGLVLGLLLGLIGVIVIAVVPASRKRNSELR
jgi:Zn-dependent protease with chaperone function